MAGRSSSPSPSRPIPKPTRSATSGSCRPTVPPSRAGSRIPRAGRAAWRGVRTAAASPSARSARVTTWRRSMCSTWPPEARRNGSRTSQPAPPIRCGDPMAARSCSSAWSIRALRRTRPIVPQPPTGVRASTTRAYTTPRRSGCGIIGSTSGGRVCSCNRSSPDRRRVTCSPARSLSRTRASAVSSARVARISRRRGHPTVAPSCLPRRPIAASGRTPTWCRRCGWYPQPAANRDVSLQAATTTTRRDSRPTDARSTR